MLYHAILRFISDKEIIQTLAKTNGKLLIEQDFSMKKMGDSYLSLINKD